MKRLLKLTAWPVGIALLIGLYFLDNIRGYYRFKEICEKEAGLHVYQPLDRNVGWSVTEGRIEATGFPVGFNEVAFVRYRKEKDGNLYDVYRVPKLKVGDPGYAEQLADGSKAVVYQYHVQLIHDLPNEIRMGANHYEITDLRTAQLAVRYSGFGYSKFNPDRTILGAPSGEGCPDDIAVRDPKTGKTLPSKIQIALVSAFNR